METNANTFMSPGAIDEVANFVAPNDTEPSTEAGEEVVTLGEDGILVVPNIEPPPGAGTVDGVGGTPGEEMMDFVAPSETEPFTEDSENAVTLGEDGVLVVPDIEPPGNMS